MRLSIALASAWVGVALLVAACSSSTTPGPTTKSIYRTHCEMGEPGTGCSCFRSSSGGDAPNDTKCDPTIAPPSVCCQVGAWPDDASSYCQCLVSECRQSSGLCRCWNRGGVESETKVEACAKPADGLCCQRSDGDCSCTRRTSCDTTTGEVEVPECKPSNVTCGANAKSVPACSLL